MSKKSWSVLKILLGIYLTYIGIQLMYDVITVKPSDLIYKCVMGAVFVIIGIGYAFLNLRGIVDFSKWKWRKKNKQDVPKEKKVYRRPVTDKTIYRTAPMPTLQEIEAEKKEAEKKKAEKKKAEKIETEKIETEKIDPKAGESGEQSTEDAGNGKVSVHIAEAEERISSASVPQGKEEDACDLNQTEEIPVLSIEIETAGEKAEPEDFTTLPIEIEDITEDETSEEDSVDAEIEENDYEER